MKIIKAGYNIIRPNLCVPGAAEEIYKFLEDVGRTCYKSEEKITAGSAEKFVRGCIQRGHEAIIEHAHLTVRFYVDRGISHEIVRHRLASFAQESTRYCNYAKDKFGNEITVVEPVFYQDIPGDRKNEIMDWVILDAGVDVEPLNDIEKKFALWLDSCVANEKSYFSMLYAGANPQEARDVLPTSLKTELVMTANIREWRHFLKLRAAGTTGKPHPQMLEVAVPLLNELREKLLALFDDIEPMSLE